MTTERPMFPPRAESVDSFFPATRYRKPEGGDLTSESSKPVGGIRKGAV